MATGNFDKKLKYNALVYRLILHLIIILKLTHLHNRLLSGSNARHLSTTIRQRIDRHMILPKV